jgi:lipopolysaccharide transport system permease protein
MSASQSIAAIHVRAGQSQAGFPPLGYRDFLYFLVLRNLRARYAQSALGLAWAFIQPVFYMGVLSLVFGYLLGFRGQDTSYALFALVALVPWTFFSSMLQDSSQSIIKHRQMVTKVYFPRVLLPLAECMARLLDVAIGLLIIGGAMWVFGQPMSWYVLALPLFLLWALVLGFGLGMGLSALTVYYRDVRYALPFLLQLLFFASPVVYGVEAVPLRWQGWYALNPLAGLLSGFRWMFLGADFPLQVWLPGLVLTILLAIWAWVYFHRRQGKFADFV